MCLFDVCSRVVVFATGVIKDPVEFAIFAYVDTWGGVGDVTVLATCTHGRCSATHGAGGGGVFLLEVQYSILKSLISTCVLSYVGSREDWLLDRICESKKDCWDSIRRTSYPYQ